MPSKPKIQKEEILKTALDIVRRDGYGAINIMVVAKEMGCSTQPISWQFGGMDGFRTELAEYAMKYAVKKMLVVKGKNPVAIFLKNGEACVDFAIDEPNVFQFVFMGGGNLSVGGGFDVFLHHRRDMEGPKGLGELLGITNEQAEYFMDTMIIYAQGVASLIASRVVDENKETAHRMLREAGTTLLRAFGVSDEKLDVLLD